MCELEVESVTWVEDSDKTGLACSEWLQETTLVVVVVVMVCVCVRGTMEHCFFAKGVL